MLNILLKKLYKLYIGLINYIVSINRNHNNKFKANAAINAKYFLFSIYEIYFI
jgi:hypothetical protein